METKIKEAILLHKAGELQKAENVCLEIIQQHCYKFFWCGTHKPEVSGSIPLPATILERFQIIAPLVLQW